MASSHHPLPPMPPPPTPPPARPRQRRRSRALIIALIALALSANGIEAAAPVRYNINAPSTSYLPPTPPRKRDSYLPPPGRVQRGKRPPAQPTTDPIYFSSSHGSFPFSEQAGRAGGAGAAGANGKGKVKGKGKAKAAAAEQAPEARPDAFPYLSDIGLRHKVPFKSGMPQAGASWAEAGLRPNVDPKMPSEHRPERKAPSRKAGGGGGAKGNSDGGRVGEADNEGDAGPSWTLAPEDPSRSSSSDADAAALAEEWSHQPGQPSSPISPTTSASSPFSSNHPPTPALLRLGSHLLSSSKQVWKWLASTKADHHDGIALTMLKPKVHRPVVAHLPLIPNDSKRDLVALIVGTLCVFALGTMLWNSRVSQEEFVRLKRLKEVGGADGSAARSPEVLATLGPGEQDRYGAASAAYSSSAGRRRRRVAKQQGSSEGYDVAGSGDESDGDATLMGGAPGWAAAGRRPKPISRSSADSIGGGSSRQRGSSGGFFGGWLGGWNRSRGSSRSDGAIALPLLGGGGGGDASSSSRSSTPRAPHFLFEDHDYDSAGSGGLASASVATPTTGRRWGLPTPSSIQSALVAATAPSTPASELPATATTSEGSSSFFASRPFRSLTPQPPQTQRQRERDRSRERRRRAREEREQQLQQRPASDQAALAAELEDGTIGDDVLAGLPLRSASANSHRSWAAAALRWGGGSGGGEASGSSSSSASASASNSIDGLASISVGTYQADGGWRHIGSNGSGAEGSASGSSSRVGTPRLSSAEQMKRPGFRWAATNDEQAGGGGGGHDGVVGGGAGAAPPHAGEWDQHQGSEGHATAARWKGKGRDV